MIYRLKEYKGDAVPVPQLVFSKLGIAEEYSVRVALYVLATGITDPDKLCAELKLRSRITAESALSFWAGAGLLERYDENAAPSPEPSAPAPMTWQEIAAASRTDPMISSLIDCGQTSFGRALTHKEMEKLVNLYVQEAYAPETVMLCLAYTASLGKRTLGAVDHELKVWRAEGVETGEQADAHLKLLALRRSREQYVCGLLGLTEAELTLGGATLTVLGPVKSYPDANNTSIVLKAVYGNTSFLFTGDMETQAETDMLDYWEGRMDFDCDVLKVGHHGSSTSTSYRLLHEVTPAHGVISVGEGNDYGHPHKEPLSRLKQAGVVLLRTDQLGHVIAESDGETISFTWENQNAQPEDVIPADSRFIGNNNSKKFHAPGCANLPTEKNQVIFDSYQAAIDAGYSPCGSCLG